MSIYAGSIKINKVASTAAINRIYIGGITAFGGAGGTATPSPGPSNFAPYFTGTPSGSTTNPDVGEIISFINYGSTGFPEPLTTFQWYDDSVAISGATGYTYAIGLSGGQTYPATEVSMTGNLTGFVTLTNSQGTTGTTIDFGTMINADITNISLSNVVAGATLTATVTYGGTAPNIVWTGVTS